MNNLVNYGASSSEESDQEHDGAKLSNQPSRDISPNVVGKEPEVQLLEPEAPNRRSYSSTPQPTPDENDDEEGRLLTEGGALLTVGTTGGANSNSATPSRDSDAEMDLADVVITQVPPSPPGECDPEIERKFVRYFGFKDARQCDMNRMLTERKDFKNPAAYELMTQQFGIDEYGTNFDPAKHGSLVFEPDDYYDALSEAQAKITEREQAKQRKRQAH